MGRQVIHTCDRCGSTCDPSANPNENEWPPTDWAEVLIRNGRQASTRVLGLFCPPCLAVIASHAAPPTIGS